MVEVHHGDHTIGPSIKKTVDIFPQYERPGPSVPSKDSEPVSGCVAVFPSTFPGYSGWNQGGWSSNGVYYSSLADLKDIVNPAALEPLTYAGKIITSSPSPEVPEIPHSATGSRREPGVQRGYYAARTTREDPSHVGRQVYSSPFDNSNPSSNCPNPPPTNRVP